MVDTLIRFLKTGFLGPISLRISLEDLVAAVGEPSSCEYEGTSHCCCVYGNPSVEGYVMLPVDEDGVTGIWVYWHGKELNLPSAFGHDMKILTRFTSAEEFKRIMEENAIPWYVYEPLTFDDQITIQTPCGVHAGFMNDGRQDPLETLKLTLELPK